jgi:hypothetical protein
MILVQEKRGGKSGISHDQLDQMLRQLGREVKVILNRPDFILAEQVMQVVQNLPPKPPP